MVGGFFCVCGFCCGGFFGVGFFFNLFHSISVCETLIQVHFGSGSYCLDQLMN